jgi:hypothetical protein
MAYRDIKLSKQPKTYKENISPVFSDLIGEMEGQGKVDNFIDDSLNNLSMPSSISSDSFEIKFNSDLKSLLTTYKNEAASYKRWLTIMGLVERKILQLRCYKNPTLAFSIQEQKSGEKTFSYIVIRALFIDLYSGKKEIRRYFNKLEDYPKFKSLEELKTDKTFLSDAIVEIKSVMAQQINKEGITIEYLESELRQLQRNSHASDVSVANDVEAKKKARLESNESYRKHKEEVESHYTQEEKDEILRYKNELRLIDSKKEEENYTRILKTKENERHKEEMKRLKHKRNLNL